MGIESAPLLIDSRKTPPRALSDLEKKYLASLTTLGRIDRVIEESMKQGVLVHFGGLYTLVRDLALAGVITSPEVREHFDPRQDPKTKQAPSDKYRLKAPSSVQDLSAMPFFRNLPSTAVERLWAGAKKVGVAAGKNLFEEGDSSREMYLLIAGNMGLYRRAPEGGQIRINEFIPGAVFGEGAFLTGNPRAGTVKAMQESELLAFTLPSDDFAAHLDTAKVKNMQPRMWALNAVMRSDSLRLLPAESIDQLIFSGRTVDFKENATIFKEDGMGRSFFVVINGSVSITQKGKTINVMKPGSCFGEIALFFSKEKRTASAIAQTAVSLLEIDRETFYKLLINNLALAREVERGALERLQNDRKRAQ